MLDVKAGLKRRSHKLEDDEVLTFESDFVGPFHVADGIYPGFTRTLSESWFDELPGAQ